MCGAGWAIEQRSCVRGVRIAEGGTTMTMATPDGSSTVTGEWVMPHVSAEDHAARGKAERAEIPRVAHATWEALPHRPDPIALLEEQTKTRVPALLPIRWGRMLVSPFAFYRGAACV